MPALAATPSESAATPSESAATPSESAATPSESAAQPMGGTEVGSHHGEEDSLGADAQLPLPQLPETKPPPWRRRLEVGGDFAYVHRPWAEALGPSAIRYAPTVAWGVHLRWNVTPWLRFHPYFLRAVHEVLIPSGALSSGTDKSISASASFDPFSTESFVFGAKLAPSWAMSDRARAWLSVGVGWGRFQFPRLTVTEPAGGGSFEVRERSGVFVEIPVGMGIAYDLIPRWLALSYEISGAPLLGQSGEAHEVFQAVNADGVARDVGPLGAAEASFVQTLGLSLIL